MSATQNHNDSLASQPAEPHAHLAHTAHHTRSDMTSIDPATGNAAPAELAANRTRAIFTGIADRYDIFNRLSSFGFCVQWTKRLVETAPLNGKSLLLDVAAGTGEVTFACARKKHPQAIWCTDLVPAMLDVAKARYEEGEACGVPVTFLEVDAQQMPFPDNSFSTVTMAYGIRNMPERERALAEIYRVLAPGGTFVCLEFSQPTNPLWATLYHAYLAVGIPLWGKLLTGNSSVFHYFTQSIRAFPAQQDFAAMLAEAGFQNITWKNLVGGIAAIHVGQKPAGWNFGWDVRENETAADAQSTPETLNELNARRVILAFGGNVGDAPSLIEQALEAIRLLPETQVIAIAPFVKSEPAYYEEQEAFTNTVALIETALPPYLLLDQLHFIEDLLGRTRPFPNAPRTIDIDIIDYEGFCSADPALTLPHPRALERDFVVTPLLEICPDCTLADGTRVTRDHIACGKVISA